MKKLFSIAAVVLLGVAASAQERSFTVQLPAGYSDFKPQAQTTHSADGDIQTMNWVSKAPTGEAVIVTESVLPKPVLDGKKMIEGATAGLLKSVNGTMESEEPRTDNPASERIFFKSPQAFFRARLTVQGNHFYQLLYVGRSEDQRKAAAVGQLFDSFTTTPPPMASAPAH